MPRPSVYDRARLYVSRMDAAISGSGGHTATFGVAMALVQGFDLPEDQARALLHEYNQRCEPPWSEHELEHKLRQAAAQPGYGKQPRGFLRDANGRDDDSPRGGSYSDAAGRTSQPKPEYNEEALRRVAAPMLSTVSALWIANRSVRDPATVSPSGFLEALYAGEKVVVFDDDRTQGALWPSEPIPTAGPFGVWFLAQPVDGEYRVNPRSKNLTKSRRIEECVTAWRYLVLESDHAPRKLWLAALAQLPLRITAIYTSGGRSIHALVRVDAVTKSQWDAAKHAMKAGLVTLGADPNAMSAVRLTRLPGCIREGKRREDGSHERFDAPALQKLLYINPRPEARPLAETLARRDVEAEWLRHAASISDSDETGGAWVRRGLEYYAPASAALADKLAELSGEQDF